MHHAWSELTLRLQQFYLRRGGIVRVEIVERGAYLGYGTRPVSSRRSLRGGQKSSMSSRLGTSYRRIKCAHQGGAGSNEAACGGAVLVGVGAGGAVGTMESAGGGSIDTGAGARMG